MHHSLDILSSWVKFWWSLLIFLTNIEHYLQEAITFGRVVKNCACNFLLPSYFLRYFRYYILVSFEVHAKNIKSLWNKNNIFLKIVGTFFWTPQQWPEGSYELGSVLLPSFRPFVLPSFCPSARKFPRDWLISFFWNSAWY